MRVLIVVGAIAVCMSAGAFAEEVKPPSKEVQNAIEQHCAIQCITQDSDFIGASKKGGETALKAKSMMLGCFAGGVLKVTGLHQGEQLKWCAIAAALSDSAVQNAVLNDNKDVMRSMVIGCSLGLKYEN